MICVYPAGCTGFSAGGNGTPAPLSAEVREALNGECELTSVYLLMMLEVAGSSCFVRYPYLQ